MKERYDKRIEEAEEEREEEEEKTAAAEKRLRDFKAQSQQQLQTLREELEQLRGGKPPAEAGQTHGYQI